MARWGSAKTTRAVPSGSGKTVAGRSYWLWRILAVTSMGAVSVSKGNHTQSFARRAGEYRASSGPTVTVLAPISFRQTYTGSPMASPSPLRWPMV